MLKILVKKNEFFDTNLNLSQKLKSLVKHQNFSLKSKFWSKIRILAKNKIFA